MLCSKPITVGTAGPFGCGQCQPCRINRRREWVSRCLLEHAAHDGASAFVTLTYKEEPKDEKGRGVLVYRDVRNFVQRLRRVERRTRYCVVGEYGERSMRPHYHVLHWSALRWVDEGLYRSCWPHGFVHVGEVSEASIGYTVGYLLKRMTRDGDERLDGRPAEFGRYSRGIGRECLGELRRCAVVGADGVLELPREYWLGGKLWPFPRYVREKLEKEGYVFRKSKGEVAEAQFVSRLRACSRVDQASGMSEFRSVVKAELEARRSRSAARLRSNLGWRKHEAI